MFLTLLQACETPGAGRSRRVDRLNPIIPMSKAPHKSQTAMMRQWADLKRDFPACLILFRLGDFYEAFNEDAAVLAEVCGLTLTSRPVSKGTRIPMAGVPYHAVDGYIAQLVKAGVRVAIAEQTGGESSPEKRSRMSRPASRSAAADGAVSNGAGAGSAAGAGGREIIRREVVRVVTAGTLVEGDLLESSVDNFLAALSIGEDGLGLAHLELSTGDFSTTDFIGDGADARVVDELTRLRPAELLVPEATASSRSAWLESLGDRLSRLGCPTQVVVRPSWHFEFEIARRSILEHFGAERLDGYGCAERVLAAGAAGAAIAYVLETQRGTAGQIMRLSTYDVSGYLVLDAVSRRSLEISRAMRDGRVKGSLLWVIDMTVCAMGGRTLRRWVERPLAVQARIESRLDAVQALLDADLSRDALRAVMKRVPDLERLTNRVVAGYAGPRELAGLADGLLEVPELVACIDSEPTWADRLPSFDAEPLAALGDMLRAALADDPPATLDGTVFRRGFDPALDAIHDSVAAAREWIAGLEARERSRTGIERIKVGYNKVFGYFLSVPKRMADDVPADWIRKQTLVDQERYVTPELKEREGEVLEAERRISERERALFAELVAAVVAGAEGPLSAARDIGRLDALSSLAEVARRYDYSRPEIDDSGELEIRAGRHPVVERMQAEPFVPNDLTLRAGEIALLTGPNMAGKSTIGRQAALITILAHVGCFVPARSARIGLADRVFTRIGAHDEIAAGQSTFMVEMVETANILNHATARSLVILDELGRGTSTYDGIAIAWAVIEYLHDGPTKGPRTIFATHYHELTALAERLARVTNLSMAVAETDRGIRFLHRVEAGAADRSYGVHVAELAGLPRDVVRRAWEILGTLEADAGVPLQQASGRPARDVRGDIPEQLPLLAPVEREHPAVRALRELDPDNLSPLEALEALYELRSRAMKG